MGKTLIGNEVVCGERKSTILRVMQLKGPFKGVADRALNFAPTVVVMSSVMLVFGFSSYFLEKYVATANTAIVVFVIGSYLVFSSYYTFDFYLKKYSRSYVSIPEEKQFYVLSNAIKSAALLAYSPLAATLLHQTIVTDIWPTQRIHILGILYTIPDFVSLFMVKRMARSTVIHHIVVIIFNFISLYNDYDQENICRAIMIYAVWSTFAYLVNLLLASRFMEVSSILSFLLSMMALLVYALCCFFNWIWQVWYIYRLFVLSINSSYLQLLPLIFYLGLVLLLVHDDVILMQWLKFNAHRQLSTLNKQDK